MSDDGSGEEEESEDGPAPPEDKSVEIKTKKCKQCGVRGHQLLRATGCKANPKNVDIYDKALGERAYFRCVCRCTVFNRQDLIRPLTFRRSKERRKGLSYAQWQTKLINARCASKN